MQIAARLIRILALSFLALPLCANNAWGGPFYQFRPAEYWITKLGESHIPNEIFGRSDRKKPLEAMRSMGPAAVPACIKALSDARWHVRVGAAEALALYGPDASAAVPVLADAIKDRHFMVREFAAHALWKSGGAGSAAIPALTETALTHGSPMVQISAAYALAKLDPNSDTAFAVLVSRMSFVDAEFRAALGTRRGDPGQVSEFVARTGKRHINREAGVRAAAARALGMLGPSAKRAVPDLIRTLTDPASNAARAPAARALGQIGPDAAAAVPALAHILRAVNVGEELFDASCWALANIGFDSPTARTLLAMLKDSNPRFDRIATAFGGARDHVVADLVDLVKTDDETVAKRAVWALRDMKDRSPATIAALIGALKSSYPIVRGNAASALGGIGGDARAALPILNELRNDEDEFVRSQSTRAIAAIAASAVREDRTRVPK